MNKPILIPAWMFLLIFCLLIGGVVASINITPGAPTAIPSGGIILTAAASCPGTTTEYTAAEGLYLVGVPSGGTVAGTLGASIPNQGDFSYQPGGTNAGVGYTPAGTNGTVSFTPAGTNAALDTHSHELPLAFVVSSDVRFNDTDIFGQGTTRTVNFNQTATSTTGSPNVALSEAVSGGTATFTGTAGTVSAQTFTGTAATISPQVFTGTTSTTHRSSVAPFIQLRLCQQ